MNNQGRLYWITGLSGAGKTTLGKLLYEYLKTSKDNVVLLDGDELRNLFPNSDDYSKNGRLTLARSYSKLCKLLTDQGIDVICCTISMFDEVRKWNRENIKNYYEIYLKVSKETLIQRDQKGLYSNHLNGNLSNLVGFDLEFEEPKNPDIVIENNGNITPVAILNLIIERSSYEN